MIKSQIKQILLDQKQEAKNILGVKSVEREKENEFEKSLKNDLIKVIIGVRRCGKSFLAHRVLRDKNYGYINFDDERLIGVEAKDLNDFLEVLKEINPHFNYLLLDEVQNIAGWELFANRLKRNGYNLIITGSNSKLLSKELATHLTGRHYLIELFPFSFKEFLNYQILGFKEEDFYLTEKRAQIKRTLDDYLEIGGFPELFKIETKKQYLTDLYNKILTRDIVTRYNIKHFRSLKEIALYVLSNYSSRMTFNKLKNVFEIKSVHTIKNYIDYLEEAYIMFQLYPLSFKLKEQLRSARKIYSIDIGFIKTITSSFSDNQGRLMENIVFLELKIDGKEIYYYVDSVGGEIDFLIKQKTSVEQLIQVCFSLNDPETKKRETKALIRAGEELKCSNLLIITWDEEGEEKFDRKTVKTVPLWKWLLK